MKTLTLLLLIPATFWIQQTTASTTLDLPIGNVYENPVAILSELSGTKTPILLGDDNNPGKSDATNDRDTVVIDLAEIVITSPFPSNSADSILEQVPYPVFAQEEGLEGGVILRFSFDPEGKIHVLESNATDYRLENYVIGRVENLQPKRCMVEIGKDYYIKFIFKLL
ncbi:MAG: hypothetical protein KDD48_05260 [Bdellovibrionales bacterium]|nr:hypothetical protein [Bdellovibrionales bacterium]